MFSDRLPQDLRPNAVARARARRGAVPYDLTVTNPTACGIRYPDTLFGAPPPADARRYRPDARGWRAAREAVAGELARQGAEVDPERVLLTSSTSEAYAFLFKLLGGAGDAVLVPSPSYPLFEHLARLEGLRPVRYALDPDDRWQPDPAALRRAAREAPSPPRAVVAVHPNNPTGSPVDRDAATALRDLAAELDAPLIVDEVFLDYPLAEGAGLASLAVPGDGLSFVLGGLSKSVGLPQAKLSWIVACGPARSTDDAMERLEFIADQYLTVGSSVQHALPALLRHGAAARQAILERCRTNLRGLGRAVAGVPGIDAPPPVAGWTALVQYPHVVDEESLALELLDDGVAVHPGYFFDLPRPGCLVVSLLPEPSVFVQGVRRMLDRIADHVRRGG